MNNNWLGAATAPAGAGVDRRMEVRRLLHAVFLAGLQSIPASTREAAIMEGATRSQVFFKVTLLLRPTLSFRDHHRADLLHHPD